MNKSSFETVQALYLHLQYGYVISYSTLQNRQVILDNCCNDQISYGMKHFLGNLDVEAISKGEHPDFGALGKMGMIVRGILNKKLAEGLRFTTQENRWLTDHYNNYPESPDGFEAWSTKLRTRIADANTKLERFQN